MIRNPYQQYKQTQVTTAQPERLILMLYDGGIKFLNRAKEGLKSGSIESANNALIRAQRIVMELQASVNNDAGELAQNLSMLYDFMHRQLLLANLKKDVEPVEVVLTMLRDLRETWAQAMQMAGKNYGSMQVAGAGFDS